MTELVKYIGQRFGKWVVLGRPLPGRALCRCDCGTERVLQLRRLLDGRSKACGCVQKAIMAARAPKPVKPPRVKLTTNPWYPQWAYLRKKSQTCGQWRDSLEAFAQYAESLGPCPSDKHVLARPDLKGPYQPGNYQWTTFRDVAAVSRVHAQATIDGITLPRREWAAKLKLTEGALSWRLRRGTLPTSEALSRAPRAQYLEFKGETLSLNEWAERLGFSGATLTHRLSKMPVEEALLLPFHYCPPNRKPRPPKKFDPQKYVGRVFGCLTVLSQPSLGRLLCQCDCGTKTTAQRSGVLSGHTTSCGCLRYKKSRLPSGLKGRSYEREYHVWKNILLRCYDPKCKPYVYYGGRGITVYEEWKNSYEKFRDYVRTQLGPRPSPKHSIDRINNNRGYEPNNLRWATPKLQASNTRKTAAKPLNLNLGAP